MKGFLPRTLHPGLQILLLLGCMVLGACVGYAIIFAWAQAGLRALDAGHAAGDAGTRPPTRRAGAC